MTTEVLQTDPLQTRHFSDPAELNNTRPPSLLIPLSPVTTTLGLHIHSLPFLINNVMSVYVSSFVTLNNPATAV